ncbi:hypothetical protein JYU34_006297 [Plutella xylostella]|uniref:Dynactin subunit 4 n=1 Tax=Plutella xylostella TaxID=51655 RepID=A0ABQ7QRP4_PLUXY|nr:hypothetical protein JYU34_006297 [Plutella xylostella]
MAYLTQPDYVTYVCSCSQLKPITSLYFCRHCLQIRCGFCICHEVDSHYCANCLENMPSSEARLKKNRCSSCFDCPSCFHTLSTRATLAQQRQSQEAAAAGDTKVENKASKKMYYLSCFNCRWTSRDVGIPDQPVGGWPERTHPHAARLAALLEHCRAISQLEKQDRLEKERKKFTIRGKYITLTDKTGLTGAMARSLAGMPAEGAPAAGFPPSVAEEEVEGLPEDFYTKEVDLKQITSMPQRLASPEWQPVLVSRLQPLPRALSVKRSQRCRQCDHNLTKPEYNPGSIKFKIELLALYHVPEVKIISCDPLKPGGTGSLLLKLCNPTPHELALRLLPHDYGTEVEECAEEEEGDEKEPKPKKEVSKRPALPSYSHLSPLDVSLSLAQRDDAAEYDDDAQAAQPQHEIVMWRKSNKMALRLNVSLSEDAPADRCAVAFTLEYSYRNTLPPSAAAPRQPQDHTLRTTVLLDLGKLTV